jgi:hypothetical protein
MDAEDYSREPYANTRSRKRLRSKSPPVKLASSKWPSTWTNKEAYMCIQQNTVRLFASLRDLGVFGSVNKSTFHFNPHEDSFYKDEEPEVSVTVSANGACRAKGVRLVQRSFRYAQAHKLKWLAMPVAMLKTASVFGHALSLLVHVPSRECWVFEPHGGNPAAHGHPAAFSNFYSARSLKAALTEILTRAVPRMRVWAPMDWLPPVWGQSWLDDSMCFHWAMWFIQYTVKNAASPSAFVDYINTMEADPKTLRTTRDKAFVEVVKAAEKCVLR